MDYINDNDIKMMVAKLLGRLTGCLLKYVCLAWAIAWGIHLASTL